jgi:hypothetical protein
VCEGTMNYYRDKMERLTALRQRERLDPESE